MPVCFTKTNPKYGRHAACIGPHWRVPRALVCSMKIRFPRAKRDAGERVPAEHLNSLRQACEEFGRQDLYQPLSWVLNLNIRWLDTHLDYFLQRGRYVIAANVMLYESKKDRARKYFEEALRLSKPGSARQRRLTTILANLDTVAKIARRSWEIDGKYAPRKRSAQPFAKTARR
jgi:hypothetical protein